MAPFRYESSIDPRAAGTISDLVLRRGDIAAHAVQQNGAVWNGAAQNIGQMIGALPGQIALGKRAELQDKIGALQLQGAQQAAGDDQRLRSAYQQSGGDPAQMRALLASSGGLTLQHDQTLQQMEQQQAERHNAITSQIGLTLHDRLRPDDPTNNLQAMQEALDTAEHHKLITSEQAQQFGALASADPTKIPEVAKSWAGLTAAGRAEIEKTITAKPGEVTTSRWDNKPVGTPIPEKTKYQSKTALLDGEPREVSFDEGSGKYFYNGEDVTGRVQPVKAPKGLQARAVLLDGKPTELAFNPETGGYQDEKGGKVEGARVKPIPPASVQVTNLLNAGGKEPASAAEKAIGDYKVPAPSARTMATPAGKAMMDRILAYNPDYDASQFPTRAKMRIQFSSGPQSQTINSINTAIGHLDQFVDVAKAMGNGNFQPGNQAYNWVKTTFGDSAPTNFEGIRSIMAGELASAFKKSGATDQEIASVEKAISSKASTTQLVDYATKIAIPALGSKIAAFDQQYKQVMGKNDPFKVLTPDAEEVLTKYGFDPAHPRMGGGGAAAVLQPNASHVVMQGGIRYNVTTDASGKVISSQVVK